MRRSGYLRRRAALRSRSRRREAEDRAYADLRAELLDGGGRCAAPGFHDWHCSGRRVVHHVLRRSQGGTNARENLLVVCAIHHRLIHDNPAEAVRAGLLRYRHPAGRLL